MSELLRNKTIPAEIMHLVPRYLAGSLPQADAEAFEEYCILHPEVAAEVENERMLREGLVAVHHSQVATAPEGPVAAAAAAAVQTRSEKANRSVRPAWGRWLAVAATLAVVLFGLRVLRQSHPAASPLLASAGGILTAAQADAVPQLTLLTLRGRAPVLEVSDSDRLASIELQPDPPAPGAGYQLSLEELDASEHWTSLGSMHAVADASSGNIRLAMALAGVPEGRLRLVAQPDAAAAAPFSAEFLLRHRAGAAP